MDHIWTTLKNKSQIGSIKVSIDREYPDEELVKFPRIANHFYGCGWASKGEKATNSH
jgi:hypothetical protein